MGLWNWRHPMPQVYELWWLKNEGASTEIYSREKLWKHPSGKSSLRYSKAANPKAEWIVWYFSSLGLCRIIFWLKFTSFFTYLPSQASYAWVPMAKLKKKNFGRFTLKKLETFAYGNIWKLYFKEKQSQIEKEAIATKLAYFNGLESIIYSNQKSNSKMHRFKKRNYFREEEKAIGTLSGNSSQKNDL